MLSMRLAIGLALFGMIAAAQADVPPFYPIGRTWSVSNYIPDPKASYDLEVWKHDLDGMRRSGFNTVWMVNVWAEFMPSVSPPAFNEDRLRWLQEVCKEAKAREMNVMLVLGYVGEGWGPKGVDEQVWFIVPEQFALYRSFIRRMAAATKAFDNVFYLLASEELLSATILYQPAKRSECVESFRTWAYSIQPDVSYWNRRWGTSFTWDTLSPANTTNRKRWESWADHNRWFAWLLRLRLPDLTGVIRSEKPEAIIGFHDFLLDPVLKPTEGPIPSPNPFNFYSLGWYWDAARKDVAGNLKGMQERIRLARRLYPKLPLWMGELGADISQVGEAGQKEWLQSAARLLQRQNIGYSVWNWRHYIQGGKQVFSLLREDGTPRPALEALRFLQQKPPLEKKQ